MTSGKSGPGSDGNEGVLHIPLSSGISGPSPSDYLVSYPRYLLGESDPFAVMLSVYSIVPADGATIKMDIIRYYSIIHI